VPLPPAAVATDWLNDRGGELPFSPGYGEHTDAVLKQAGFSTQEIDGLRGAGVIA
jgi:crotonobetainyl-CoA:carnitine CoA-transferase CaiB-like acyl-CoA transferase